MKQIDDVRILPHPAAYGAEGFRVWAIVDGYQMAALSTATTPAEILRDLANHLNQFADLVEAGPPTDKAPYDERMRSLIRSKSEFRREEVARYSTEHAPSEPID